MPKELGQDGEMSKGTFPLSYGQITDNDEKEEADRCMTEYLAG